MDLYYLNKNAQTTGEHEVHKQNCSMLPDSENCIYLGIFDNARDALKVAKRYYDNVDGCYYCSPEIHRK